jgi:hypothetical protein
LKRQQEYAWESTVRSARTNCARQRLPGSSRSAKRGRFSSSRSRGEGRRVLSAQRTNPTPPKAGMTGYYPRGGTTFYEIAAVCKITLQPFANTSPQERLETDLACALYENIHFLSGKIRSHKKGCCLTRESALYLPRTRRRGGALRARYIYIRLSH